MDWDGFMGCLVLFVIVAFAFYFGMAMESTLISKELELFSKTVANDVVYLCSPEPLPD